MFKYFRGRLKYLLISLLLLSVFEPFLRGFGILGIGFMDVIYTIVLLSALYAISDNKKLLITGIILVIPIFVISWMNYARNIIYSNSPQRDKQDALAEGTPLFQQVATTLQEVEKTVDEVEDRLY